MEEQWLLAGIEAVSEQIREYNQGEHSRLRTIRVHHDQLV
jgi:hypothetical protein